MKFIKIFITTIACVFFVGNSSSAENNENCTLIKNVPKKLECKLKNSTRGITSKIDSSTSGITSKKTLADFFKKKKCLK